MYEVRWTCIVDGRDGVEKYDDKNSACKAFDDIRESRGIESVGCYYIDGDGNEKELLVPSRRYKKTVRKKKIPEMIPGEEYDIMCPQFWQPIGQGGKKNGAVKKMQLVDVSEGVHTRHYVFKHPEAGWLASFREQDLTKVLIVEKGVM